MTVAQFSLPGASDRRRTAETTRTGLAAGSPGELPQIGSGPLPGHLRMVGQGVSCSVSVRSTASGSRMSNVPPISLRRFLPSVLGAVACMLIGVWGSAGWAAATIDAVEIGFQGQHKMGFWTPVWVTVTATDGPVAGHLEIRSVDGSGVAARVRGPNQATIDAGQTVTLLQYVKVGRPQAGLTVSLRDGDQVLATADIRYRDRPRPLMSDANLILSLGGEIGVAQAMARDATAIDVTPVQFTVADRLPRDWFGYEGVDAIIMTTGEHGLLSQLSARQTGAIRNWVEMGGQLVLCGGASGADLLQAPSGSPLQAIAEMVPGTFQDVVTVGNSAALENYTGGAQSLSVAEARRIRMTQLEQVRGNVELYDEGVNGRRPMVIRAPFGFGQVVFAAFDLDQPPLSEWEGRSRMVVKILRGTQAEENRTVGRQQSGQVSHVGYDDMVGQLRGALDQFTNVSFVAFSVVAALILVYIIVIGPVDFLLLKNVLRRMQLTWVTFPLAVCGFIGLAVVLQSQLKNDSVIINQVDLIDVDASSGLSRGTTWAHLYSPVTETYDLTLAPLVTRAPEAETSGLLSWQGMPGAGLGGLNSTSAPIAFSPPYTMSTDVGSPVIAGLPIPIGSTAAVSARWWQRSAWEHQTTLRSDNDDLLQGTIVNPLDVELHECMLFYSVWAYDLQRTRGRLAPGQTARAEDERPRNLQWRMTRRAVQDMKDVATPWDPASFDVPRIMEMMMFRGVAGGDQYTKLTHHYQAYTDLSEHLQRGRAVLVGRVDQPGTRLTVDGHAVDDDAGRHWTFCRIVFPVERAQARSQ